MAATARPAVSSLVKILESKIGVYIPYKTFTAHRRTPIPKTEIIQYYKPAISAEELRSKLQDETDDPMAAILQRNAQEKNALHYLFSTEIYSWSIDPRNFHYFSVIVFRKEDEGITVDAETRAEVIWSSIPSSIQNQRINSYKCSLFKTLLDLFPDDSRGNARLCSALFHPDKTGDSVLHIIFKNNLLEAIEIILPRIARMTAQQKYELASALNNERRSIFHYIAEKVNTITFKKIVEAFGSECIRGIFPITDKNQKNILHAASECRDSESRLQKIAYLCGFLKSAPEDEKKTELSISTAFQIDIYGQSPLARFCGTKSKDEKCDKETLQIFVNTLRDEYMDFLSKQDCEGRNCLHLAAENRAVVTFDAALEAIPLASQKANLLLAENNKTDTAWHNALSSGEPNLLLTTFKLLDSDQLFKLDCSDRTHGAITEGKMIGLYEREKMRRLSSFCFVEHILLQVTRRISSLWTEYYRALLEDARQCIAAKKLGKSFLSVERKLASDTAYIKLRGDFGHYATSEELEACERYFDLNKKYPTVQTAISILFSRELSVEKKTESPPITIKESSVTNKTLSITTEPHLQAIPTPTFAPITFVPPTMEVSAPITLPRPSAPPPDVSESLESAIRALPSPPNRDLSSHSVFASTVIRPASIAPVIDRIVVEPA